MVGKAARIINHRIDEGVRLAVMAFAKVFDKLATDPAKDGTGLDLAIVKQIVEADGGTVSVESNHDEGATFCFTIPEQPQ